MKTVNEVSQNESLPYPRLPFYLRGFVPVRKYDIRYQIFLIELVENVTNFSPLVFFLIDCSVNGSVRLALWLLCVDFIPGIHKNFIYQFDQFQLKLFSSSFIRAFELSVAERPKRLSLTVEDPKGEEQEVKAKLSINSCFEDSQLLLLVQCNFRLCVEICLEFIGFPLLP